MQEDIRIAGWVTWVTVKLPRTWRGVVRWWVRVIWKDERRTGTDCRRNKLELANGKKMAEGCNVREQS